MSEAADSLRSTSYARTLDLIGEGEIVGLVNGHKSIYLEDTPLQNSDGSYNFQGVTVIDRKGTIDQAYIPGFESTEATTAVNAQVKYSAAVTRTITDTNADRVRIIIGVPTLSQTSQDTGDISGTSVNLQVQVQPNGGSWGTPVNVTITGKTTSRYQRQVTVPLPAGGAPWNVRVSRTSNDSDSVYLQKDTYWDSYVTITDERLRMPWSAVIAMAIDAQNFSGIPSRAFDVKLKKVLIPSNYAPDTRTYTGSWDGTFHPDKHWTDNPAWCFYDLLTNPRYGLGAFVGTGVDKWALYSIGKYCDGLVPDGKGGMEPRYTCNHWISTRAEAYKVINDMASIFRGMVYWASGSITAVQDAPSDPVALYAPANVIDGMFTYSGASAKAKHTAALVTWNDPADMCRQKVEYVEDAAGIARWGLVTTEVQATGCTSRGQANRVGRWLLASERLQGETVQFKTGLEGIKARPGQVIKVADPSRAGVRLGGRLLAATTTTATLDAAVTLQAGQTYTISTLKSDGSVQDSTVTTAAGTTASLTFSPALAEAPAVGGMWVLASTAVQPQLFVVVAVSETTDPGIYEITALEHEPGKYDFVELGLKLEDRSISVLTSKPAAPGALVVTESLYAKGAALACRVDVSTTMPAGANALAVSWRRSDGSRSPERVIYEPSLEIDNAQEGQVYSLQVYALNPLGTRSATAATLDYTVLGKSAPPANVQNFLVVRKGSDLLFTWSAVADLDAARYEIRRGDNWESAAFVDSVPHPATTMTVLSPRGATFMIKAFDTSGVESVDAAYIMAADSEGLNVVLTSEDDFSGTRVGTITYDVSSAAFWDATTTWDAAAGWDSIVQLHGLTLSPGGLTGTYTTNVIDVGYLVSSPVSIDANVGTLGPLSLPWTSYTQPWSYYTGTPWVWSPTTAAPVVGYEISTSTDGLSWSAWEAFASRSYTFRFLRLRATLTTDDASFRPILWRLAVNVDVPDRIIRFADVAIPAIGATIAITPAFVGISTVQVTLQSAQAGDTCIVLDKAPDAIDVIVVDAAGNPKAGTVDVDVFGYGERS